MPPTPEKPIDTDHLLARPEASREGGLLPHKKSAGPVIGTVIVVILLLAGALYFWGAHLNQPTQPASYIPSGTTTVQVNQ